MAKRKPLVLDDNANIQQLQSQDRTSLDDRVEKMETELYKLKLVLSFQGIEVPEE